MKQYLLDTNIVIFLLRGKHRIHEKMNFVGLSNCFISEITLAELKIGAEKSNDSTNAHLIVETFTQTVTVIPINGTLDIFAKEKVRLERIGTPMHDHFDVLIAATAILHNLVVVTQNVKHFLAFPNLIIEDWSQPNSPWGFN